MAVGPFQITDSQGKRIEPYFFGQVRYRKTSDFTLLKPGDSRVQTEVIREGDFYVGPQTHNVPCRNTEHCMEVGLLRVPPDTYRLRWPHGNKENPFKTVDDRAKVWIGEVWSNTLIIQTTEKEPVKVGLDVDPDTLNFKSEGKWITAYLSAPQNAGLLATTTKFQGTVVADRVEWQAEGGGRWAVKIPRSLVIDLLKGIRGWELDGLMKVFVSAEAGQTMYWGDDKIRILEDPGKGPASLPTTQPQGPPTVPPQDRKKSPRR
ncbi:MAG: hypothetical protein HYT87_08895 [Nitrospirae bacterium]|nr:hypothetical protein [Nitrospirota bacterium]